MTTVYVVMEHNDSDSFYNRVSKVWFNKEDAEKYCTDMILAQKGLQYPSEFNIEESTIE